VSFYSGIRDTASELIAQFGVARIFTNNQQGAYNPDTGVHANTASTYTKKCVQGDFTAQDRADGTIESGDIKVIAEAFSYEKGDTVSIDSLDYRIVNIRPIKPADTLLASILQVRR